MQRHSDIVILQKENQSLRDQLKEIRFKLAENNDTILLLRSECTNVFAIKFLQMDLLHLDRNKGKLLAKINYLKSEIKNCQSSTTSIENKLRTVLYKNEILRTDIEIIRDSKISYYMWTKT